MNTRIKPSKKIPQSKVDCKFHLSQRQAEMLVEVSEDYKMTKSAVIRQLIELAHEGVS